jgi:hypothetical protein
MEEEDNEQEEEKYGCYTFPITHLNFTASEILNDCLLTVCLYSSEWKVAMKIGSAELRDT